MTLNANQEQDDQEPVRSAASSGHGSEFAAIVRLAAPLILSEPFRRLRRITFLGILSPHYSTIESHPIRFPVLKSDRTRNHHSLRVALLAGKMSEHLSFSADTIRYAIVWGLLHDIATWPLSHTGEAAFSGATETTGRKLREMMIKGDQTLDRSLCVYRVLKEMKIDVGLLLELFDRKSDVGGEFSVLHKLLHSSLTPDTLEGMHRSGRTFGMTVPDPGSFVGALERDLVSGLRLKKNYSASAMKFWRAKSRIYSNYINRQDSIAFESSWSTAIRDAYLNVSLSDSLLVSEFDILRSVASTRLRPAREVVRYKEPLTYKISVKYQNTKTLKESVPIESLSEIFTKNRA